MKPYLTVAQEKTLMSIRERFSHPLRGPIVLSKAERMWMLPTLRARTCETLVRLGMLTPDCWNLTPLGAYVAELLGRAK